MCQLDAALLMLVSNQHIWNHTTFIAGQFLLQFVINSFIHFEPDHAVLRSTLLRQERPSPFYMGASAVFERGGGGGLENT